MATINKPMAARRATVSTGELAALVVIALAGLGAWIYQLTQGMRVTGLSQQVVWALYIAAFFSAIGAGAGLLFLVGLSEYNPVLPVSKKRLGLFAALASFVAGALLILLDVGNPLQVWRIITAGRFTSMMTWDFWLLIVAGITALVYLFLGAQTGLNKLVGALAMVAATAVVVVEGWMLASLSARPLWAGGGTVVSFLLGALAGGLALWILADGQRPGAAILGWLRLALAANLILVVAEVVTRLIGGAPRSMQEIANLVLGGSAAPVFWFHILFGLVLPLALLLSARYAKLAAALALLGLLAEKSWMLVAGQATPWLQLPEGTYLFTWVELVAVAGVVAIGVPWSSWACAGGRDPLSGGN